MTTPFADLSLHYIGDEALLLDPTRQQLYALNACAGFIWSSLMDGKSPAEVSRLLNDQFNVPADTAVSYVASVLRQYDELIGDGKPSTSEAVVPLNTKWRRPCRGDVAVVETYSLLDSVLCVHYEDAGLFEEIHPLLQHRATAAAALGAKAIVTTVVRERGGVAVIVDEELVAACPLIEEAAVMVRACLSELAIMRSGGLCAIHAGALGRNGRALLLPGDAGHGKSTLSAGLAARGFEMLCDDTALLVGAPPLVRCIPTGLCVKRGAYGVLEPHYPQLASLVERQRPDGRQARYLMPGTHVRWADADAALAVGWIVFPRYSPERVTALAPLPRHEALARLLRGIYFLSGPLDDRNLETLIAWIERIECYELPLSSLDEATALLEELCA
jgi:hypothetical protein